MVLLMCSCKNNSYFEFPKGNIEIMNKSERIIYTGTESNKRVIKYHQKSDDSCYMLPNKGLIRISKEYVSSYTDGNNDQKISFNGRKDHFLRIHKQNHRSWELLPLDEQLIYCSRHQRYRMLTKEILPPHFFKELSREYVQSKKEVEELLINLINHTVSVIKEDQQRRKKSFFLEDKNELRVVGQNNYVFKWNLSDGEVEKFFIQGKFQKWKINAEIISDSGDSLLDKLFFNSNLLLIVIDDSFHKQ